MLDDRSASKLGQKVWEWLTSGSGDDVLWRFVFVSIALVLLWAFIIDPYLRWLQLNWVPIAAGIIMIGSLMAYLYNRHRLQRKAYFQSQREKRIVFEESQRALGLESYRNRAGEEKWGTPSEVSEWKKAEIRAELEASLYGRVLKEINDFTPKLWYDNEYPYHTELVGWLKRPFPELQMEYQTGASRPDIVIGDIAIEIKGPTDKRELDSLTTKCLKYEEHWKHIILVIYRPLVTEADFDSVVRGLKRKFPTVEVVRKGEFSPQ